MNTLFHFNLCWTDRYAWGVVDSPGRLRRPSVAPTIIIGFILLVVHTQTATSVLAFRVNHQFMILPLTHPFPYPFQPLNKAVHL